ncbi:hypothetical protein [Phascolarctobacterium succinatutens]|nr:MAG TPA: hypothetical protein [Bacteriophage sp.]
MKLSTFLMYVLLAILIVIAVYGLFIFGVLGFIHLLMGVFNLGF